MRNGERRDGFRWCVFHGHLHGNLYPCASYPADVLSDIAISTQRWREQLANPHWRSEQIANGVPEVVLDIFRELAE